MEIGVKDPAFMAIVKEPGVTCWRIEKMNLARVSGKDWGALYEGDSYIVISTTRAGPGVNSYRIHFWLGKFTSVDEAGVAAYKTVEIDDSVHGAAVQHRELQGHESSLFLSYFPKGLTYKPGGIQSGLKHVAPKSIAPSSARLLHLKGKRRVRMQEVALKWESFNSGDTFIVDLGRELYVWNGKASNKMERIQAMRSAMSIRDSMRGGDAKIHVVEETDHVPEALKEVLGPPERIKGSSKGGSDEEFERLSVKKMKMYLISDSSGSLMLTEIGSTPLTQNILNSKDCFIVDTGGKGIFVWKGKYASKEEKSSAMKNALAFIRTKKYPPETKVSAVIDGGEPTEFKMLFPDWKDKYAQIGLGTAYSKNAIAKVTDQTKFDVESLLEHPEVATQSRMVDDGTGDVQIWVVENFEIHHLGKEFYGQFFAGDCYIIQYTYEMDGKKSYILYYWIGSDSTQDERGTVALKTIDLDNSLDGAAVQVRVTQGKEPNHFLAIFRGKLVVHLGGKNSGFRNLDTTKTVNLTKNHLYRVRGDNELNTRAVEVECIASQLNSNDAYILKSKKALYIWFGKLCNGDEREMTRLTSKILSGRDYELILEGKEPAEFWKLLGGRAEYPKAKSDEFAVEPRLFQCSNASGKFQAEEIMGFIQEDLCEDDVMILDAWFDIFVWIGNNANKEERKKAQDLAMEYLKTDIAKRDPGTTIYVIKQGFEPLMFTGFFTGWTPTRFLTGEGYVKMKGELKGMSRKEIEKEVQILNSKDPSVKVETYTYEDLTSGRALPVDCDPAAKEMLLSEKEFLDVFKMSKNDFLQKPMWKRLELKKKYNLF